MAKYKIKFSKGLKANHFKTICQFDKEMSLDEYLDSLDRRTIFKNGAGKYILVEADTNEVLETLNIAATLVTGPAF